MNRPYQCGSPVVGDNFYGRQNIISGILDDKQLSHVWVIGTRRSGKTSLLHQLRHVVNTDKKYSGSYIPIFWDMQGVADRTGLQKRLLDELDELKNNHNDKFEILGIDLDEAKKMTIEDILHKVGFSIRKTGKYKLLLLCDEVEALIDISQNDDNILSVLRYYFQTCKWTHTVIAATGALWKLREDKKDVSPFLSGFNPPQYALQRFSKREAVTLIRKGKEHGERTSIPDDWEDQICELTDQIPFYIQLLCMTICDSNPSSLDDAKNMAFKAQNFDRILKNDLEGLNIIDKMVLLYIVENPGISLQDLQAQIQKEIDNTENIQAAIENLKLLCYIKEISGHRFSVQNYFLHSWYLRNLRKIVQVEIADNPDTVASIKSHPLILGMAMGKFRTLENLIRTYIEQKYDSHYNEQSYFEKKKDFDDFLSISYTPDSHISFNELIKFLRKASERKTMFNTLFQDGRDQHERNYRFDTLDVIRSLRNLMFHSKLLSNEEISALEILCQEMVNYFNRILRS